MKIKESGEMYLEAIYVLSQKSNHIHAIDVVEYTGYSKPSISRAINILKKNNYLKVDESGHISLMEKGLEIAKKIYERHTVLSETLMRLGISEKTALEDACKIEHIISDETFEKIKAHVKEKVK